MKKKSKKHGIIYNTNLGQFKVISLNPIQLH